MDFHVIIPARYGSQRFPGKPLCLIQGKPMIQHVYEKACQSKAKTVVITSEDTRILDVCRGFGAYTCLTAAHHLNGTERLAEVVNGLVSYEDDAVIVNVQGDQPLIPPENINQVAKNMALAIPTAGVATLCERIHEKEALISPSVVKTLMNHHNHALYFSRSVIPFARAIDFHDPCQIYYKHIGLYAYTRAILQRFAQWAPSAPELAESLEQLRFLSYGENIHIALAVKSSPPEINTPDDLIHIKRFLKASH